MFNERQAQEIIWMPTRHSFGRVYRTRVTLFLLFVAVLVFLIMISQVMTTLHQLDVVERQRDTWQKPSEIMAALGVKRGDAVADLGCGSGYFTLKISSRVGKQGEVVAVDIRRASLFFLWLRTIGLPAHNVKIIHGQADDPHLGTARLDAVFIANTYHEFTNPDTILAATLRSLHRGGRLVVVDRGPEVFGNARDLEMRHHELSLGTAKAEIGHAGFEITGEKDRFIEPAGDSPWWLVVAVKP